jgi:uncharacterized protein YjiS (DUF1127 family)
MLKRLLVKLIRARQKEANRQIALMQLNRMSDRELSDIGIGRGDIRRIVYASESNGKTASIS